MNYSHSNNLLADCVTSLCDFHNPKPLQVLYNLYMPKRVAKEAKRVPLNCLVLPETVAWLRAANVSQGVAVDLAVARAKAHIEDGWQLLDTQEGDVIIAMVKPIKSPQKWKRGSREKGDRNR